MASLFFGWIAGAFFRSWLAGPEWRNSTAIRFRVEDHGEVLDARFEYIGELPGLKLGHPRAVPSVYNSELLHAGSPDRDGRAIVELRPERSCHGKGVLDVIMLNVERLRSRREGARQPGARQPGARILAPRATSPPSSLLLDFSHRIVKLGAENRGALPSIIPQLLARFDRHAQHPRSIFATGRLAEDDTSLASVTFNRLIHDRLHAGGCEFYVIKYPCIRSTNSQHDNTGGAKGGGRGVRNRSSVS